MTLRKKAARLLTPGKKRRRREPEPEPDEHRNIVLRSEGQRLLLQVIGTIKSISTSCSVSHQSVIDWRYGRKMPGPPARAALWNAYEIPAASWGRLPAGQDGRGRGVIGPVDGLESPPSVFGNGRPPWVEPTAPPPNGHGTNGNGHGPPPPDPRATASAPSSLDETATLLGRIRAQLNEGDLLPSDRVRITDSYTRTLALQHRLQREVDLTEDRIIREHPTWLRIRAELARVLARHPQAAAEVCEALDRLNV